MAKRKTTARARAKQTQVPTPMPTLPRGSVLEESLRRKAGQMSALASVFNAGLSEAKPEHWGPALSLLADFANDVNEAARVFIEHNWRVEQCAIQWMAGVPVQVQK